MTLAGLGAVVLAARTVSMPVPPCPLRALTGIPCPGCGMTRTADAIVTGRLGEALATDAAAVLLLAAIAILAAIHLVRVVIWRRPPPAVLLGWAVPVVLGVLVAVHWATTLVTGGMTTS